MYADLDNLKALCGDLELIQLTDQADPPSGEIDEVTCQVALVAASAIIDGFVAAQYQLPLASKPQLLIDYAVDIARYRLYKTAPTEEAIRRNTAAMAALGKISTGAIKLPIGGAPGGPAEANEPAGRPDVMVIQSEDRRFSRSSMAGL